jgi:hypothetical protein
MVQAAPTTILYSLVLQKTTPSVTADGRSHPAFFLGLQDTSGKPRLASSDLNVTLSCSDNRILQIQKSAVIKLGQYYVIINATSNVIAKSSVEITASASGYTTSKITHTVDPPSGTTQALQVTILPNMVTPLFEGKVDAIISLADNSGNPTKAPEDIVITLSSSDLRIADISQKQIKVEKGNISATTEVITTRSEGTATITATAPNLKPGSANINVIGPKANKLYLWSPSTQIPDENNNLFVAILDGDMKPLKASSPVTINLISSNSTKFSTSSTIIIEAGEWKTSIPIKCRSIGEASIYASAPDLTSASIKLTGKISGGAPAGLKIYSPISNILVDEFTSFPLTIQLVDNKGSPTLTNSSRKVNLFSDKSAVFEPDPVVSIPNDSSFVEISSRGKTVGEAKVTAISPELSSAELKLVFYAPTSISLVIQTSVVPVEGKIKACLLAFKSGNPIKMPTTTIFTLSSSNTGIAKSDATVTINEKTYFSYFLITGVSPGTASLTATGSGLTSVTKDILVTEVKPSTFSVIYYTPLVGYQFPLIIQSVSSGGIPAINYEPVEISISSSNPKDVSTPNQALIYSNNTETVLYGIGQTTVAASITFSSSNYKSVITKITAFESKLAIAITANNQYLLGELPVIKAQVTINSEPVKGAIVTWKGEGFQGNNTITDDQGFTENILKISKKSMVIKVSTTVAESKPVTAEKTILGKIALYTLEVKANVPITIDGSGKYPPTTKVELIAPSPVAMEGFLGLVGGRYIFVKWEGYLNSVKNTDTITISGDTEVINVLAIYSSDYIYIIVAAVILIVVLGSTAFYFIKIRKK